MRSIKKNIKFNPSEWKEICRRAECVEMKINTFVRRMSLRNSLKVFDLKNHCTDLAILNGISVNFRQIISVAESTHSPFLDELKILNERLEKIRGEYHRHYSEVTDTT